MIAHYTKTLNFGSTSLANGVIWRTAEVKATSSVKTRPLRRKKTPRRCGQKNCWKWRIAKQTWRKGEVLGYYKKEVNRKIPLRPLQ